MARFEMSGMDDLMKQMEQLADLEEVAPKMIDAATPTIKENLSKNIRTAANRGYATGELAESIQATKAKQNAYGYFAAVRPTGADKKGTRNGEKLAYLEYGVSGKQEPHPVMAKTINESEEVAISKMQEVFNRENGL